MAVADNGVGLPPGTGDRRPESLGTRIVEILTGQLGGSLERQSHGGLTSIVKFTRFSKV